MGGAPVRTHGQRAPFRARSPLGPVVVLLPAHVAAPRHKLEGPAAGAALAHGVLRPSRSSRSARHSCRARSDRPVGCSTGAPSVRRPGRRRRRARRRRDGESWPRGEAMPGYCGSYGGGPAARPQSEGARAGRQPPRRYHWSEIGRGPRAPRMPAQYAPPPGAPCGLKICGTVPLGRCAVAAGGGDLAAGWRRGGAARPAHDDGHLRSAGTCRPP